jgi:ABC-2 type transport system permease protein
MNARLKELAPALQVEYLKIRRSKTLWLTILAFAVLTIISGLLMFILKDPVRALQLGLIGAKAQIFDGTADWLSFFNLEFLLAGIGGLIIFGFIFVWIFGREYSDKTYYDMLSLPTSRVTIVIAKIIMSACWSMALILLVFLLTLGLGLVLQLPGGSAGVIRHGLAVLLATGALMTLVCIPFGFVSYLPVVLAAIIGIVVTTAWWRYADQTCDNIHPDASRDPDAIKLYFFTFLMMGIQTWRRYY